MPEKPTRRVFLTTAAATGSGAVMTGCTTDMKVREESAFPDKIPEPLPKGLEYALTVRNMAEHIIAEDTAKIDHAVDICTKAVTEGKTVYYTIRGHNEAQCILETMPGRPSFLTPLHPWDSSVLKRGDVVISVRTNHCAEAIEHGAQAIGILMPFQPQKTQGQGIVHTSYDGPYMEDIADVCIWDRTPYTVGILDFDQLPWKSLSAHGALDGIILGLITAGTIDNLISLGIAVTPV
ncbi:hypothetical protein ACFL47_00985 [Candidatus Latescibacterota bacterium]